MKNNLFQLLMIGSFLGLVMTFSACKPEDPHGGEEEITTVKLIFNGGPTVSWKEGTTTDPEIVLDANATYTVSVEFLNEEDPNNIEDITVEVRGEDDEHLVCYEVLGGANATITRTDSDGQFEVGLATEWETGAASSGTVMLTLRHQPGVKDGTCTPGDSDVEVTFNITIQ